MNHQNTATPISRLPEDAIKRPGRIDGSIPSAPKAWLHVPAVVVDFSQCVTDHIAEYGFVRVPIGDAAVTLYSGDQARAFIVKFARAAELLDDAS